MRFPSEMCDLPGCQAPLCTTCWNCGRAFCGRHIRWIRGSYFRGGYYACDACSRQSDISFWAALLTVAAIALTPMVAFTAWILFDFLQLVVRGFVGA